MRGLNVLNFNDGWVPYLLPTADQQIAMAANGTAKSSWEIDGDSEYLFWSIRHTSSYASFPDISGFRIQIDKGEGSYSLTGGKAIAAELLLATAQRPSFFGPRPWYITTPGRVVLPISLSNDTAATLTVEMVLVGARRKLNFG